MSTWNFVSLGVALVVLVIVGTVGLSVTDAIAADAAELDPDEPVEVTGPSYDISVAQAIILLAPLVLIPAISRAMAPPVTTGQSRFDTPEETIDRYKDRYVAGEMSLEEFEDKVYETVTVEVEEA